MQLQIYTLEYEFTHLMPTSLSLKCRPPFKHREVLLNVLSSPSSKTWREVNIYVINSLFWFCIAYLSGTLDNEKEFLPTV